MPKTSWPKSRSVLTRERPTRPNPITANCLLIASSYRYVLLRVDVTPSLPGRKRQNQGDRSNPSEVHYPYDDQFSDPYDDQFSERRELLRDLHRESNCAEGASDLEDGWHEPQAIGDHYRECCQDDDERRNREHHEHLLNELSGYSAAEGAHILLPPHLRE